LVVGDVAYIEKHEVVLHGAVTSTLHVLNLNNTQSWEQLNHLPTTKYYVKFGKKTKMYEGRVVQVMPSLDRNVEVFKVKCRNGVSKMIFFLCKNFLFPFWLYFL
jgi:hypothetical protein